MIKLILRGASDELVQEVRNIVPEDQALVASWSKDIPRDMQHSLAVQGTILYGSDVESTESPMFAGLLDESVLSRVKADIDYTEGRRGFFANRIPANYVGRIHDDPKNLIVGNPDGLDIKPYLGILPEDWWGSLGFITEYSPKKLFTICEMYLTYSKPIAVTKAAVENLKKTGLDFVDATEYPLTQEGGILLRGATRRDSF